MPNGEGKRFNSQSFFEKKWRERVNFTNILRATFPRVDPKSVKRH